MYLFINFSIIHLTLPQSPEMSTKDIRDIYAMLEDSEKVLRNCVLILPLDFSVKRTGFEQIGFDCLVTIHRIIYACLSAGPDGPEGLSPILRYAWGAMAGENDEHRGQESQPDKDFAIRNQD